MPFHAHVAILFLPVKLKLFFSPSLSVGLGPSYIHILISKPTVQVQATLPDTDSIYTWLHDAMLSPIFVEPTCGDGNCDAPEEYPTFEPHSQARKFTGCPQDCGVAPRTKVAPYRSGVRNWANFGFPWIVV